MVTKIECNYYKKYLNLKVNITTRWDPEIYKPTIV